MRAHAFVFALALAGCASTADLPAISTDIALAEACQALDEQTALAEVVWDRLGPKDQDAVMEALGIGGIFCAPGYRASAVGVALVSARVVKLTDVLAPAVLP